MNEANHQPAQKPERSTKEKELHLRRRAIVAGLGSVAVVGAALGINHLSQTPEFSEETTTYTLEPGDGIWQATYEIEGVDRVNDKQRVVQYIADMPENIDVFADDRLDPGEQLAIPVSVE